MYTPVASRNPVHTQILYEGLLDTRGVPGGLKIKSDARGFFTIILIDENSFYLSIYVAHVDNIIMSHIHFRNKKNPNLNGPILLWITETMKHPVSIQQGYLVSKKFYYHDFINIPNDQKNQSYFKKFVKDNDIYINIHSKKYPEGELASYHSFSQIDLSNIPER